MSSFSAAIISINYYSLFVLNWFFYFYYIGIFLSIILFESDNVLQWIVYK